MASQHLRCRNCGRVFAHSLTYSCASCGFSLEVEYDYQNPDWAASARNALANRSLRGIWRFQDLLPVAQSSNIVSLGEGNTPLVLVSRFGRKHGVEQLYLKNESANPTASFKDRPTSVGISVAKELGAERVIIASSGNAGASAAAYAARAGLPCVVVVPEGTPPGKVAQALSCGARVVCTQGPSYSNSFRLAKEASEAYGWANVSSTFLNPFTVEGDKTVAYEIWEQLGRRTPDWIIVPIGAGPLLVGILKGFKELTRLGLSDRLPAMIGVQSEAVHPVFDAFVSGSEAVQEWHGSSRTVASGIADPLIGYAQDGTTTLDAIRSSNGYCVVASDQSALIMGRLLAETEGIFVEPTSATGLEAVAALVSRGVIRPTDTVVAIMTGHGLKTPEAYLNDGAVTEVATSPQDLL